VTGPLGGPVTVSGRVVGSGGAGVQLAGYRVEARTNGTGLADATSDESGRFAFPAPVDTTDGALLHVTVIAPWGERVGEATVEAARAGDELVFPLPLTTSVPSTVQTAPVPSRPEPLLAVEALAGFYRAVSFAEREGAFARHFGPVEATGWMHFYETELEELEDLSRAISRGDMSRLARLHAILDDAPELPAAAADEHGHAHQGTVRGRIRAHSPGDVVAAAALLDLLEGSTAWTRRAAGYYLTRVNGLERALRAAERFSAGDLDHRAFESEIVAAGPPPTGHGAHAGDDHEEPVREGDHHADPLALEHIEESLRPLAHCLATLIAAVPDAADASDSPVAVGRVEPDAVCVGTRAAVRLLPPEGIPFPSEPQNGMLLLWDGSEAHDLKVRAWRSDRIEVQIPRAARPGCGGVAWRVSGPSLKERLIDAAVALDPDCRPFLIGRYGRPMPGPSLARISLLGPPSARLTADGHRGSFVAEAGADVALEWGADAGGCGLPIQARLLAGDEVVIADAGGSGRVIVDSPSTTTYRLVVESSDGRRVCGEAAAEVTVVRRRTATVFVHDRVHRPGEPLAITVRVPYAEEDALEVEVRSSDPDLVPETKVTIPAGETEATARVYAGGEEGTVTLRARARPRRNGGPEAPDEPDVPEEPGPQREVRVGRSSCVEPRYGGSWETATISVTEAGDACPPATVLRQGGETQLSFAGARLTDAASNIVSIPDCWAERQEKLDACSATEAADYTACDAAHAQRTGGCTVTCTAFTNCDSISCTSFTNCASITCTSFTNCNDFWATDPRRYACYTARGVCVAAKAVEQAACWTARGVCVAAKAAERAACVAARAVCVTAAAAATAACIAASAVLLGACKAAAFVKATACKAAVYAWIPLCVAAKIAAAAVLLVVAVVHIIVGAALNTAGALVAGVCSLGRSVGLLGTPSPTTATRLRVVGVHLAVLHTGKVLIFSYDEGIFPVTREAPANPAAVGDSDRALSALYDPMTGTATYVPLNRNLFCSGHAFAADGRLLVAGGQFRLPGLIKEIGIPPRELAPGADKDLHLFDPVGEAWTKLEREMEFGRWYPTCVTMPDGKVMVASGTNAIATVAGFDGGIQHTWKIVDPATGEVGPDLGFNRQPIFHNYPFMLTLPNGEIFAHYKRITRFFREPGGWGLMSQNGGGSYGGEGSPALTMWQFSRTGPGPGTCCLLPLIPTRDPETGGVSYPPGRILIIGGGGAEGVPEPKLEEDYELDPTTPANPTAEILDLSEVPLQWRYTGITADGSEPDEDTSPMKFPRVMPDPVLLPDGSVLVVNGAMTGMSGGFLSHLRGEGDRPPIGATDPVQVPERFDPITETWEALCPKAIERLYHATAVLLPDARVLVAGHDGFLNMAPHDLSQYELEIFSPPYLHRGPRPAISSAPESVAYGSTFRVGTEEAASIGSVCLIRQSSITHQTNTDQRYVGLAVVSSPRDGGLVVQAPPNGSVAPPGWYMLFVVTPEGVPSVARWVRVGRGD
jgi:Domain of unknown function (DUF1929)